MGDDMGMSVAQRAQRYRAHLRASGMRPIQIWVPDTRVMDFQEECKRQSLLVAKADRQDSALIDFMDELLEDMTRLEE